MVDEFLPQLVERSVLQGLDGPDRPVQGDGGLFEGQVGEEAEDNHIALVRGQAGEHTEEFFVCESGDGVGLGITMPAAQL